MPRIQDYPNQSSINNTDKFVLADGVTGVTKFATYAQLMGGFIQNNSAFTRDNGNTSAVTVGYIAKQGNLLIASMVITVSVAIGDAATTLGSFNLSLLGISSVVATSYFIGQSDGGNTMVMLTVNTTGTLTSADTKPNNLSVGDTIGITICALINPV